jgi:superfamily I DNA/RNA helicase
LWRKKSEEELIVKNELQIIGPPGTGKTTFLTKQVIHSCAQYGSDNVMVTSLTKTAAKELAGRNLPLAEYNIGTLHSFCYRELKMPVIAETMIKDWNQLYPHLELSDSFENDDLMEHSAKTTANDLLLSSIQLKRAQMLVEYLSPAESSFFEMWTKWKQENLYVDFTDMIERGLSSVEITDRKVIIADEVQDYSKLEMALIRKWGENPAVEKFIIAGDSDQLLYEWRGADPELFHQSWVTPDNRKVLKQSFRVPQAVHQTASKWINNIKNREQIEYFPTEKAGKALRTDISIKSVKTSNRFIKEIEEHISKGKEVMILVSCGYMLTPILSALRSEGLLFHNPYRTKRGDWNPLRRKGVSAKDRILTWVISDPDTHKTKDEWRMWTIKEVQDFSEHFKANEVFIKGRKNAFLNLPEKETLRTEITDKIWNEYFVPEALHEIWSFEPERFLKLLMPSKVSSYKYPMRIAEKFGYQKLLEKPLIKIGTIHSVKGGEADIVYLFPDLSQSADRAMNSILGKNAVIRTFYVGMTRAKEELHLCEPSNFNHVVWGGII